MDYSTRMMAIIADIHRLVNQHRENIGLAPIQWKDSRYVESGVVVETIMNTEVNHKVDGITELPPTCSCKPDCEKLVRRSPRGGGWNKFAFGHNPKGTGGKSSNVMLPENFEFTVKVFDVKTYEQNNKVKDKRIFNLLSAVEKGGKDEVTVVYLQPELIKGIAKSLNKAIAVLRFQIEVDCQGDHIALTKK